jgi:hypothetical protein
MADTLHSVANRALSPSDEEAIESGATPEHPLTHYQPPFDLLSDMIFVAALCPTGPLRQAFPGVPLLSIFGRTPLFMWFSRVKEIRYHDENREHGVMGGPNVVLYNELNVVAAMRQRGFFVPGIYATSPLTIQIGRGYYGMPKYSTEMTFQVAGQRLTSEERAGLCHTTLRARLFTRGMVAGKVLSRLLPLRTWPACLPSGDSVRALIERTPRAQPAWVRGRLELDEPWLPEAAPLLPFGLYLPDLRMQLPRP